MIKESIFGKRLRQKDGHRIMIVGQGRFSDEYKVYIYRPKVGYAASVSSPLYKKSWLDWTLTERRENKRMNKVVLMTESFVRRLVADEVLDQ
jgi:hypothetical protein